MSNNMNKQKHSTGRTAQNRKTERSAPPLPSAFGYTEEEIRQYADYTEDNIPVPDNNPFWENGHNPLSSKGN